MTQTIRMMPMVRRSRRGFSLVEVAVATALVGGILVAALDCVGAVVSARHKTADGAAGALRAQQLAAEILSLPVLDPDDGALTLGPDSGEDDGTRSLFDNLGDYCDWRAIPQNRAGNKVSGMETFMETVSITTLPIRTHGPDLSSSAVLLEVTVEVVGRGRTLGRVVFVRTAPAGTSFVAPVVFAPGKGAPAA
jgi:prepilin-type N-terminal cleavage/methylation domain-containing protein